MNLPGDPNYPPGVSDRSLDDSRCPQCGSDQACDCEPDGDPRTYQERMLDEKAERQADFEREEKVIGE